MNKKLLIILILLITKLNVFSQSISIDFNPKSICPGGNLQITFTKNNIYFNNGNTFNIELSNEFGNFGSPILLSSVNDTIITSVLAELPKILTQGSGYKIRIVSNNPSTTFISTPSLTVHPRPVASYTFTNDSQCYTWNNYQFNSNSTISSGTIDSFIWYWGDGRTDSLTINTASHKFINFLFFYYPKLTVVSNLGCTDSFSRQVNIKESTRVLAEFNDTIQCLKGNFFTIQSRSDIYTGSITYKSWLINDGTSLIENIDSFSHSFINDGAYQFRQINHHSNGCIDTGYLSCLVNEHPNTIINTNDTDQCLLGNYFTFESLSTIGNGLPLLNYWNINNTEYRDELDSIHKTFNTHGNRTIELITISDDGIDGCADTSIQAILVNPMPIAGINNLDGTQCFKNNLFRFKSASTISNGTMSHFWRYGDGNTSNNLDSTAHTYNSDGNYTIKIISTSNKGCIDSTTTNITIRSSPIADFSINNDTQCYKYHSLEANSLSSINTGTFTNEWIISDGNDYVGVNNIVHEFSTHGNYTITLALNSNFNCKDSITYPITILEMPVSTYNIDNTDQCFRENIFNFENLSFFNAGTITNTQWLFGDGNSEQNTNITNHRYNSEDIFNTGLVVIADNGCIDTSFQIVKVYPHPGTDFNINDADQCINNNTFVFSPNSFITEGGFTNRWFFGDGTSSNVNSPSKKYNKDTTYTIINITYSDIGCTDTAYKTVTIYPKSETNFSINNDIQCLIGNTFNFNSNTTLKSGTFVLNWNFGNGNVAGNSSTVSQTYGAAQFYNVRLISTTNNGCLDTIIRPIRVLPMPNADFNFNYDRHCLQGNNFEFNVTSTVSSGLTMNHKWYYGNGDSLINSTSGSKNYLSSGIYTVRLISSTNIGNCKDTIDKNIQVFPMPNADFDIDNNIQCIQNNLFNFTSTSTVSSGTIDVTNWKFGDNTTSTSNNPSKSYNRVDSFRVSLIVLSDRGCLDSTFKKTYTNAMPIANFDITPTITCFKNNSIRFTNKSTISKGLINEHIFYYGDGDSIITRDPANYNYSSSGDFKIILKTTSDRGCQDTVSRMVYIKPNPDLNFEVDPVCLKDSSEFTNLSSISSGQIISWRWFFGNGRTSTLFSPKHKYRDIGNYDIRLIATTDQGCVDTLFIPGIAIVNPNPKSNFTYEKIRSWENEVDIQYRDLSTDAIAWNWDFSSMGTSNEQNPLLFYNDTLRQLTSLIVTNIFGCRDTSIQNLFIMPDVIYYVPTAFSPNDDNINETFKPVGLAFALEFKFIVFNRWGEILFETINPQNGWDGKFNNKIVEQGLYFYRIEFIGADELRNEEKGNVLIVY
ncbi:MAG: PKD domain-containing protein [Bacteroidota bacterium]|nr:PKD domain-containing protein [Bacteroidota bacterium]